MRYAGVLENTLYAANSVELMVINEFDFSVVLSDSKAICLSLFILEFPMKIKRSLPVMIAAALITCSTASFAQSRVEKIEKPEKVEQIEKAEKPEKVEKVEKAQKPEKVEKVEKVEKPERVEKVEKAEKPEKVEKPEKSGKRG